VHKICDEFETVDKLAHPSGMTIFWSKWSVSWLARRVKRVEDGLEYGSQSRKRALTP
jgi:hypothetical protein